MIGLLQRVTHAKVAVNGETAAEIGRGIMVLVAVERDDDERRAERLLERLLGYRVFADAEGRMNLSVRDVGGGVLLVPQFTLAADTDRGMRASFSSAADPAEGRRLFDLLMARARAQYPHVSYGVFGADMQVSLTNDGPVTFWIEA